VGPEPGDMPPILRDVGAMFVPFSPTILGFALKHFERRAMSDYWYYPAEVYNRLGYDVIGKVATFRQRPRPSER
jgi:hypothetical protein